MNASIFKYILIIGAAIIPFASGFSNAYFQDTEASTGNLFNAGTWEATSSAAVVINEVYYNPDSEHKQPSDADDNDFEWVELYNPTGSIVNLKDWKISDNSTSERTISTSNRNLNPGQFAVLAKAANVFAKWNIPSDALEIPLGERFGNGLADAGDRVILKDAFGTEIDRMSWGNDTTGFISGCSGSCPDVAEGHSLEREPDGDDTNNANDFVDRPTPSPGL